MYLSIITYVSFLLVVILLVTYNWRRRWLYYCSSKLPGPTSLPLIGTVSLVTAEQKDFYKVICNLCASQPPVFRIWIGSDFYIVNSEPEEVETILATFLNKSPFYKIWNDLVSDNILTAPAGKWKERRKMMNPTFNTQVLNSFEGIFNKYSKNILDMFRKTSGTEQTNLFTNIWNHNLEAAVETLLDVDPSAIKNLHDNIRLILRSEEIIVQRFQKFWLFIDFFWHFSSLRSEVLSLVARCQEIGKEVMDLKEKELDSEHNVNPIRKRCFVELMYDLLKKGEKISTKEFIDENAIMMVAASETTSVTLTSVLVNLALYPEIQDKIYQEIVSIVEDDKDLSLADINRMVYTECVIKETLRILPPVPVIMRATDRDIQLGSYTYPAGSNIMIPIVNIQTRPDLWSEPLKFDPDRFLPENLEKRQRAAFLAFSSGVRNCIGLRYGMMTMKFTLAYILRNLEIKPLNYKSMDDLEIEYHFMAKPIGYKVVFVKRTK